jgi:NAD(P)-dependent dehydrogenase (short-subunit alcohol dehydrogenase family)
LRSIESTLTEDLKMLLKDKTTVIYGAGGNVGSAIARKFALEGARVYLTARSLEPIKKLADELSNSSHDVRVAAVDALNEEAIERHLDSVLDEVGRLDVSFNAVGVHANIVAEKGLQGIPLTDIPLESFSQPIATYTQTHFLTGRAAVRRMIEKGTQGVILMHTPEPARMGLPLLGGWRRRGRQWKLSAVVSPPNSPLAAFALSVSEPPEFPKPQP